MTRRGHTIKLRAWDNDKRAFIPIITLALPSEEWTIVQFTGVVDYFGNEIWEGDIIRWTHFDERDAVYCEYYYEVVFQGGGFGTLEEGGHFTPYERARSDDVVAGNVFADSYLLTQSLCLDWQ